MLKISVNILTKNRSRQFLLALDSVLAQSFTDFEVIVVDDGSTPPISLPNLGARIKGGVKLIRHNVSFGITASRQEALEKSTGEYIAVLDDDDRWVDVDKLKKQVEFLDGHPDYVLAGGGIQIVTSGKLQVTKMRPKEDQHIRNTMLFRNNFFTSTVLFRKSAALKAGGFVNDGIDLAEDYDLWLRLGKIGKMHNFHEVFTAYRLNTYNKARFKAFLSKQLMLAGKFSQDYPYALLAKIIIKLRLF